MKIFFIFLLLNSILFASKNIVQINKHKYNLIKEEYNEYGEKGLLLNFYTLKSNKLALSFLLSQRFGGCGKRDYEESTYTIDGSEVTVYTKWSGYDIDGYRKMIYSFKNSSEKAKMTLCKFYIRSFSSDDKESGVKYLDKKPITNREKELLMEYINSMQNIYKGEFVLNNEAKLLSIEVEKALKKSLTQNWGR